MLDYGAEVYKMPRENQHCATVQEFDFNAWKEKVYIWLCWWNLCHLGREEIRAYLAGMMSTLRTPYLGVRYNQGIQAGYILLAEPTSPKIERNNHLGQELDSRPAQFYEDIFRDLGLDVVHSKDYRTYATGDGFTISEERVWILQESSLSYYSKRA